jgi:hypothetical protein
MSELLRDLFAASAVLIAVTAGAAVVMHFVR